MVAELLASFGLAKGGSFAFADEPVQKKRYLRSVECPLAAEVVDNQTSAEAA
jgi:hypothetical protein